MTYFNLDTKEGFCYTWDECNGNLSSEMFAYIHYIHFENYVKANPGKKHYIIWSDNCCHQNKNVTVANLLYHLARKYNVTIDQKFWSLDTHKWSVTVCTAQLREIYK